MRPDGLAKNWLVPTNEPGAFGGDYSTNVAKTTTVGSSARLRDRTFLRAFAHELAVLGCNSQRPGQAAA